MSEYGTQTLKSVADSRSECGATGPESDDTPERVPGEFDGYGDPALDTRLASDEYADVLPDRYRFDGKVLSWGGAVQQYLNHRRGERASVESDDSPVSRGTLRHRALQKNAVVHRADREVRERMEDPVLSLITLAGSFDSTEVRVVDYAVQLSDAFDSALDTFRYQTQQKRGWDVEYVVVLAGTDDGVPHYHMVVWIDRASMPADTDTESRLRNGLVPVVERFQSELDSTLRESVEDDTGIPDGAVRVDTDPDEGLERYPADGRDGPVHPFSRYASNQVPHLGRATEDTDSFDGMAKSERRVGAVADALPRDVSQWRSSTGVPAIGSTDVGKSGITERQSADYTFRQ